MESNLQSGVCPKCGGEDVYFCIEPRDKILPNAIRDTSFWRPRPIVDEYACGECGFVEFFVVEENLANIKARWTKVPRESS